MKITYTYSAAAGERIPQDLHLPKVGEKLNDAEVTKVDRPSARRVVIETRAAYRPFEDAMLPGLNAKRVQPTDYVHIYDSLPSSFERFRNLFTRTN